MATAVASPIPVDVPVISAVIRLFVASTIVTPLAQLAN
jgi:hypothetical protein